MPETQEGTTQVGVERYRRLRSAVLLAVLLALGAAGIWTLAPRLQDTLRRIMVNGATQENPFPPPSERPTLPPRGERTTELVLERLGPALDPGWRQLCEKRGLAYPPRELTLVAFKDTWTLHLYARGAAGGTEMDHTPWVHLRTYPILAGSGLRGPKLREGDQQVPEGQYAIEYLNPNSAFHLSFKLNYPNPVELERARAEGRDQPGSNIMVHGGAASVDCLAMGDPAVEEIFVLVARTGFEKVRAYLAPRDFRLAAPGPDDLTPPAPDRPLPEWTAEVYAELHEALAQFPVMEDSAIAQPAVAQRN